MAEFQAELDNLINPEVDTTTDVVDSQAFAKLYGEPLFQIPSDLYIPPDALEVFLEAFEGPLDLLLYLIRKQNFNVLDIPMAEVTEQYMQYVEQIHNHNLELAGEYLLMASMLIEIKSRMLLPVKKADNADEVIEDPRAELIRRLLEYEKIKIASLKLDALPQLGRDFYVASADPSLNRMRPLPDVNAEDLRLAWLDILKRASLNKKHHIRREQLSVREHMSHILRRLSNTEYMDFRELFMERVDQGDPPAVIVVHFMAMLELCRELLIEITQTEPYAPIYLKLSYTPVVSNEEN
ncbi:segregation/condensation protein A [Taylorella equigenitalis]|uniref:segregation and condensation protein A n=1 Tax=Taylorella equigenitalis TaxID=29575 RepID=UPI000424227D|nr:ScpA family protein [Taylorella equigenitalis]WDU48038.1 segregation/condensation protein A [Taylorella equigenitalis]